MTTVSAYRLSFLLLLLANLIASACAWGQNYEPLLMAGDLYQSACSLGEKSKLQAALSEGKVGDSVELWRALDAVLCFPKDEVGLRYVRALVPETVRHAVESDDGKTSFELVSRTDDLTRKLMAEGKAWSTTVRVEQQDEVVLQYFFNEGCVRSMTFRRIASKWIVHEFGTACD